MNSETLQQQFPEVYRDFFASCQRVASASNSFLWTGEFAGFYGGLTVSQKLPIRSYVGFELTFDRKVTLERSYVTYQTSQQSFVQESFDDRLRENLTHYLEKAYQNQPDFTGIKVHILTEIPLGHGLGSNGAVAAALALLLCPEADLDRVFVTARDILSLSQAGHSSGVSAYMALTDCQVPVVFFKQGEEYFARPISQLTEMQQQPAWPIDFGLIYSGGGANAESVILANQQTATELEQATHQLDDLLGGQQQLNFKQTYINMLNMASGLLVMALAGLFTQGSKNSLLEQLFNSLNQYQNLLHILHVSNGSTDLIYSRIHQLANRQLNDVGSGVKISGIGKGGAVLFALPYGIHRGALTEMISELQTETGRAIGLDYASWLDGIGGQPGRIDQDIQAGQHSSFIDRDSIDLLILNKGTLRREMMTKERFSQYSQQLDLVIDKTTGKILIAGQSLTSKDLPSQKATAVIVADLIQSTTFTLKNDELPTSYGASRYDLQGKIVLPLVKQVKDRTARDLQLAIHGGMYDNYSLTLDPSNIVIGVIEKKG